MPPQTESIVECQRGVSLSRNAAQKIHLVYVMTTLLKEEACIQLNQFQPFRN